MPNSSKTCKVGETAEISASYECLNCKYAGADTVIHLDKGKVLPICSTCKDQDTTWHIRTAS